MKRNANAFKTPTLLDGDVCQRGMTVPGHEDICKSERPACNLSTMELSASVIGVECNWRRRGAMMMVMMMMVVVVMMTVTNTTTFRRPLHNGFSDRRGTCESHLSNERMTGQCLTNHGTCQSKPSLAQVEYQTKLNNNMTQPFSLNKLRMIL